MTKEEEHAALDTMWLKIQEWVKGHPRFSRTREFNFPHDVYSWTKLEIYPDGTCAILTGSHGNPGTGRPKMIYGREMFLFGLGDGGRSWHGNPADFAILREPHSGVDYCEDYRKWKYNVEFGYCILRELYEHWGLIKDYIEAAFAADSRLENFEA